MNLQLQMNPLPGKELAKVEQLIRDMRVELDQVTGVTVAMLGDTVQDFPMLFTDTYKFALDAEIQSS